MDIQSLIEQARETMLTSGSVMPMIYLELTENVILIALDVLSDTQSIPAQCGILARLGWEECKKYPGQKPLRAGFYCEAWKTTSETERLRPVRDPEKQEIITVQLWQAEQEPHQQSYALPVIRDHKKRVVDVGPAEGPKPMISYQLASFLQGVRDSQRPDEEVLTEMDHHIGQRLAGLTEEQRRQLIEFLRSESLHE